MAIFYHNPRCSKSRQALVLLEEKQRKFTVKEYLKEGLESDEVFHILEHFKGDLKSLVRVKEKVMKEVSIDFDSQDSLVEALVEYPILLERPLLVDGKKVNLGRPPEDILV